MMVERFWICDTAASLPSRTLLSFDSGLDPRPAKVAIQNMFCSMMNVTVVYPFQDERFQAALGATDHPTR